MSDGPGLEEDVQLQTVNHRFRTSLLFGVVAGAILAAAMYLVLR